MNKVKSNVSRLETTTGLTGVKSFGGVAIATNNKTFKNRNPNKLTNGSVVGQAFGQTLGNLNRGSIKIF